MTELERVRTMMDEAREQLRAIEREAEATILTGSLDNLDELDAARRHLETAVTRVRAIALGAYMRKNDA